MAARPAQVFAPTAGKANPRKPSAALAPAPPGIKAGRPRFGRSAGRVGTSGSMPGRPETLITQPARAPYLLRSKYCYLPEYSIRCLYLLDGKEASRHDDA